MLRANIAVLNPNLRWFGLLRVRSPLLTESISLSFPLGTLMFQFPRLLRYNYVFIITWPTYNRSGSPIRKSRDLSLRPAPPGLSQVVASFIIIWLQGIHRAPH